MKSKPSHPYRTIADAVYTAIYDVDGGSEEQVIRRASKLYGKPVTKAQFKRALRSFDYRGVSRGENGAAETTAKPCVSGSKSNAFRIKLWVLRGELSAG